MRSIVDDKVYLERLAKPLVEKLKIARFIPASAETVLDAGCAEGTVTLALADLFPDKKFLGIDLNAEFIKQAKAKVADRKNVSFESGYLRERLLKSERFDVVIFCSVLHEFFTYGEGISTVVKALADGHELLNIGGTMIIRDMILYEYSKEANLLLDSIVSKIRAKPEIAKYIGDFENRFGKLNSLNRVNHFLLKYWYTENWQREGKEFYTPVSYEQYDQILRLLGMKVQFQHSYLIPYLKEKWMTDFGLTEDELAPLRSTGIIVAEKIPHRY